MLVHLEVQPDPEALPGCYGTSLGYQLDAQVGVVLSADLQNRSRHQDKNQEGSVKAGNEYRVFPSNSIISRLMSNQVYAL